MFNFLHNILFIHLASGHFSDPIRNTVHLYLNKHD